MAVHRFTVGQSIELVPGRFDRTAAPAMFTVVMRLPNDSMDREYRVKNDHDGHERVVRESQIRPGSTGPLG